jgi:predicted permease
MQRQIAEKIRAISGVSSGAFATSIPMDGRDSEDPVFARDHIYKEGELPPIRRFKYNSPGVFSTLGTPLVAGRDLTWDETYQKLPVAIVSESLAREFWSSPGNAIGKQIRVGGNDDWRQIVGVAADVHDEGVNQPAPKTVYWPLVLANFEGEELDVRRGVAYIIRSPRAGSAEFMREVRQAVWSVEADLPLADPTTVKELYTKSMARTSFTLVMLCVAGSMALLLGIVGIYGVISYAVSQRTREIGIRMALGAQRQQLSAMFVRQGLWLTGIGVAFGLAAAFAVMRLMASLLFNVSPMDPGTYILAAAGVLGISALACYLPSRRAAAVDPVHALRAE